MAGLLAEGVAAAIVTPRYASRSGTAPNDRQRSKARQNIAQSKISS